MASTNYYVLKGLHIIAYFIFVGLCIEAGALIVNFVYSIFDPTIVGKLYEKLDLSEVYARSAAEFYGIYSFIIFIAVLKAWLFYIVIRLMHKMDLAKPFSSFVAGQISKISYFAISIGLISHFARENALGLRYSQAVYDQLENFWTGSRAFILMGAVIYVIAVIFKKGVELQAENDLTV